MLVHTRLHWPGNFETIFYDFRSPGQPQADIHGATVRVLEFRNDISRRTGRTPDLISKQGEGFTFVIGSPPPTFSTKTSRREETVAAAMLEVAVVAHTRSLF